MHVRSVDTLKSAKLLVSDIISNSLFCVFFSLSNQVRVDRRVRTVSRSIQHKFEDQDTCECENIALDMSYARLLFDFSVNAFATAPLEITI